MSCYPELFSSSLHVAGRKEARGESLDLIKGSISHPCTYYSHLCSWWKENIAATSRIAAIRSSLYLSGKQALFSTGVDGWWLISRAACVHKAVRLDLIVCVCSWRSGCWSWPALCLCQLDTSCQCLSTVSEVSDGNHFYEMPEWICVSGMSFLAS